MAASSSSLLLPFYRDPNYIYAATVFWGILSRVVGQIKEKTGFR